MKDMKPPPQSERVYYQTLAVEGFFWSYFWYLYLLMFCLSQFPPQTRNSEGTKSKTSSETNGCLFLEREVLQQSQTQIVVRLEGCAAARG